MARTSPGIHLVSLSTAAWNGPAALPSAASSRPAGCAAVAPIRYALIAPPSSLLSPAPTTYWPAAACRRALLAVGLATSRRFTKGYEWRDCPKRMAAGAHLLPAPAPGTSQA